LNTATDRRVRTSVGFYRLHAAPFAVATAASAIERSRRLRQSSRRCGGSRAAVQRRQPRK